MKRPRPNSWKWCFIKVKRSKRGPCAICTRPTRFVEVNFECFLHRGTCERAMLDAYRKACYVTPLD